MSGDLKQEHDRLWVLYNEAQGQYMEARDKWMKAFDRWQETILREPGEPACRWREVENTHRAAGPSWVDLVVNEWPDRPIPFWWSLNAGGHFMQGNTAPSRAEAKRAARDALAAYGQALIDAANGLVDERSR